MAKLQEKYSKCRNIDVNNRVYYRIRATKGDNLRMMITLTRQQAREEKRKLQSHGYDVKIIKHEITNGFIVECGIVY